MIPRSRTAAADSTTTGPPSWRSVALAAAVVLGLPLAALAALYPTVAGALVAGALLPTLVRPAIDAVRRRIRSSTRPAGRDADHA
jgi:hypothetical protein